MQYMPQVAFYPITNCIPESVELIILLRVFDLIIFTGENTRSTSALLNGRDNKDSATLQPRELQGSYYQLFSTEPD